jgi:geranylgeranyl diphosphate/geranylgeranyl-bacteriochlorophyllide a reductase
MNTRPCSRMLHSTQDAYYRSDERRAALSHCHETDVQRLTFEARMNKKLVRARPGAHLRIGVKSLPHLARPGRRVRG